MQMAGGNDSLNTVIPFENDIYVGARSSLRFTEEDGILKLDTAAPSITGESENVALHPNLSQFNEIWNDGNMAIVNGVGYPNPNLSHFTSFDYYHTARPNEPVQDGWLGRFFDHQCSGCEPTTAINFSERPTLAMHSQEASNASIAVSDPANFTWRDLENDDRDIHLEDLYRRLVGLDHPVDSGLDLNDETLAYVQRAAHSAMISSRSVQLALDGSSGPAFPLYQNWLETRLANDFRNIAALIYGGLNTSIYYVNQGGYDTHNNQVVGASPLEGRHADLLEELDGAIGAFVAEMKAQGNWDRVLIMTFSEFGRKVIENGASGTDHGAAETLFVLGGKVVPGYFGELPDLSEQARIKNHSLQHNVDFRRVYRTVLENWLGAPPSAMSEIFPSQPSNFDLIGFV